MLFLSDFNQIWIIWTNMNERLQYKFSLKICPVGEKLFHAYERKDGRTDRRDEINGHFLHFICKPAKTETLHIFGTAIIA
jgi:hypothetical protein